jgi:hypothetical protein
MLAIDGTAACVGGDGSEQCGGGNPETGLLAFHIAAACVALAVVWITSLASKGLPPCSTG